jgi:DNA-binding MarR family transcriptional regulator
LVLDTFLPYRLSVLSNRVSAALARIYQTRFDLKLPEWRVMAVLGRTPGLSASAIVEVTAMDKVAISRAVARLVALGRVVATPDPDDARRQVLALTAEGQAIYAQIVPLARALESALLDRLSPAQRITLDALLQTLDDAARDLPETM